MFNWIISSSFLILAVIILHYFLNGKISSRLRYALWILVLARLLIPFSIGSSSLSILNLLPQKVENNESISENLISDMPVAAIPKDNIENNIEVNFQAQEPVIMTETSVNPYIIIWTIGTIVLGCVFIFSNLKFGRDLQSDRVALDYKNSQLPVYLSNKIETPCLFGIFKPAVYVTQEIADDNTAFYHSIEHEITHYIHKDNIWSVLRLLCLAIHWFNPLVWCAVFLSKKDSELACDEGTIKRIGESERTSYGRTLIKVTADRSSALFSAATTMSMSKDSLKERISLIAKKPKTAAITLVIILVFAFIAAGCAFTGKGENVEGSDTASSLDEMNDGIKTLTAIFKTGQGAPADKVHIKDAANDFKLWCRDNLKAYDEMTPAREILNFSNEEKLDKAVVSKLTDSIYEELISMEDSPEGDYGMFILSELKTLLYKARDVYWGDFLLSMEKEGLDYGKIHSLEQMGMTREDIVKLSVNDIEKKLGIVEDENSYEIIFSSNPVNDTEVFIKNTAGYPFLGNSNHIHIQYYISKYNSENGALDKKTYPIVYAEIKTYNQDGSIDNDFGIMRNTDVSIPSEDRYAVKYGNKGNHVSDHGIANEEFNRFIDDMIFLIDEYNAGNNDRINFKMPVDRKNAEYVKSGDGIIINAENGEYIYPSMPGIVTEYGTINDSKRSYMVLSHGNGFETVYSFINKEHAGKNTYVFPSENIGTVKKSDNSDTAGLYFEIRKDGKPLNAEELLNLKERAQTSFDNKLTQDQINSVNEHFAQLINVDGEMVLNPVCHFFTSYYDDVRNLDMGAFTCYMPREDLTKEDKKEIESLKKAGFTLPFKNIETSAVPFGRISYDSVDSYLKKYADTSLDEMKNMGDAIYSDEYKAFYSYASDFGAGYFNCTGGSVDEDTVTLYSESAVLKLRKSGEQYFITSHNNI